MEQPYVELLVDCRERVIHQTHKDLLEDVNHTICAIFPGDYHILLNDAVKIVIERKTLSDYAASLRVEKVGTTPRITNMQHMYNMRNEDPNIILILLIEHPTIPDLTTKINGIPYSNMQSSMLHHIMRGVSIFWSRNVPYSIEMIKLMMKSIGTFKPAISGTFEIPSKPITREMVITSKPRFNTLETIVMMWRQLHGIGADNSIRVAGRISIRNYMTLPIDDIEDLCKKMDVNDKAIKALISCKHTKFYDKMLLAINGISENKATIVRIAILSLPTISKSELAEVLVNNRKLGNALSEKIIDIIDFVIELI